MELVSSKSVISSLHDAHRQRHETTKICINFLNFRLTPSKVHYPYLMVHRTVVDTVSVNVSNLTQSSLTGFLRKHRTVLFWVIT